LPNHHNCKAIIILLSSTQRCVDIFVIILFAVKDKLIN